MKVFIVHRFNDRDAATRLLKKIAKKRNVVFQPLILDSSHGEEWKEAALSALDDCEGVIVFDYAACMESENATWEIEQAKELEKPLILIDPKQPSDEEENKLCALYHHNEDFEALFRDEGKDTELLYKMMVDSSELLIQRRQSMNAFFITAIGGLLAIAGALEKFGKSSSALTSFLILTGFGIVGMLLCNSWRNLIDNYGKLNAAKFRVILKLEKSLSAQVFAAEWAALGKGLRPQKYQSFTSTENLVPLWFAILLFSLVLGACLWRIWG